VECIDIDDDDDDDDEVEEIVPTTASGPADSNSYTVHPAGRRLTLVFKNSPQHTPAHSPVMPSSDSSAVREVRVQLERCDEDSAETATPTKRSRMDDDPDRRTPDPLQRLRPGPADRNGAVSEADTAVAGLLGCDGYVSDAAYDESADHFERLRDADLGVFSATETGSVQCNDSNPGGRCLTAENGAVIGDPEVGVATLGSSGCVVVTEMSAVDSLMADLSQLNAQSAAAVRTTIPNGSIYFPTPTAKISLTKRMPSSCTTGNLETATLDANSGSLNRSSLLSDGDGDVDNTMHSSRSSFAFCNRAKFDCEPELDAAIKSILS